MFSIRMIDPAVGLITAASAGGGLNELSQSVIRSVSQLCATPVQALLGCLKENLFGIEEIGVLQVLRSTGCSLSDDQVLLRDKRYG